MSASAQSVAALSHALVQSQAGEQAGLAITPQHSKLYTMTPALFGNRLIDRRLRSALLARWKSVDGCRVE